MFVDLLPRLWRSGEGFRPVAEEAEWWLEHDLAVVPGRRYRDAAVHFLRELVPTQGEQVLVHQDLHGENVLAAQREPWLVDRPEAARRRARVPVAPIVRSSELGHSKSDVLYRLDRLCSELELDRERALGWTIAQTVAWSGEASSSRRTSRPSTGCWRGMTCGPSSSTSTSRSRGRARS